MWWWIGSTTSGLVILGSMRYMFHFARLGDDVRRVRLWAAGRMGRLVGWARRRWTRYGPVTPPMREAWARLRERYRTGRYGIEGT